MKISELEKFGVPRTVISKIEEFGFKELTEVQKMAVDKGLFEGRNLIISAPTNTGKTFIGELGALDASIRRKGSKIFYLTPLKAIAEEKFVEFTEKYSEWGLDVAISTGERTEFDGNLMEHDLIIVT